ncbi:MAG: ribosome biogenesis GTPase Der [Bacteroidota bacterium]|nr:ribosome biogenesis GTPase Der [Bacteroidota bacterium]
MSDIVAIVGRPNVGKSTLFNRLTETRTAIVDEISGVTRDRIYGKALWNGIEFSVVDTGGYIKGSDDIFEEDIRRQVQLAVDEANVILFLVDTIEGLTPYDEDVATYLRKSGKKVLVVANKVDNNNMASNASVFYSLGLGDLYCISSINGSGTGELLDKVINELGELTQEEVPDLPKLSVVGRPNVGKSSFINALLDENRNIVTPIAGTTRDSLYTRFQKFGFDFYIVDTAGIRKKSKVNENLEFYSVMRSLRAIENCDVCMLMIDATQGFEAQDLNIFSLAQRNHKGIVILVNKWDIVEKDNKTTKEYESYIRKQIDPFSDVPIIFTSTVTKQRILKALESAIAVYKNKTKRIPTSELNEYMLEIISQTPPPAYKGKYIKIKYITQLKKDNPIFILFCNLPQYVRDPYKRFIENKLREKFDFEGVPIEIFFRKK